ncbi:hypothetical protein E2320_020507, partial [Naja naja]
DQPGRLRYRQQNWLSNARAHLHLKDNPPKVPVAQPCATVYEEILAHVVKDCLQGYKLWLGSGNPDGEARGSTAGKLNRCRSGASAGKASELDWPGLCESTLDYSHLGQVFQEAGFKELVQHCHHNTTGLGQLEKALVRFLGKDEED